MTGYGVVPAFRVGGTANPKRRKGQCVGSVGAGICKEMVSGDPKECPSPSLPTEKPYSSASSPKYSSHASL